MTTDELAAESSKAYPLIEFSVRVEGLHLILIGAFMGAIVVKWLTTGPALGLVDDVEFSDLHHPRCSS